MFTESMYTVPEDDPGSVELCVNISVEITQSITFPIRTEQKSPPEAEGDNIYTVYLYLVIYYLHRF